MSLGLLERGRVLHRAWRYSRRTEAGPIRFVRSFLDPGATALDIGANRGAYTFWMCRTVGPTGRVIAFEPRPEWAAYVSEIGDSFHFPQLTVICAGLSSSNGERAMVVPQRNRRGGASFELGTVGPGDVYQVQSMRLDDALRDRGIARVDLIKVDVEGHEFEVFLGGAATIARDHPALVVECQDFRHPAGQTERVFAQLAEMGYVGGWFNALGKIRPLSEFSVSEHQQRGSGVHLDNFLFLDREAARGVIP